MEIRRAERRIDGREVRCRFRGHTHADERKLRVNVGVLSGLVVVFEVIPMQISEN